ncbi:ADP-ribosylglycohydrolase family protein [Magnetospira sp. QH-2]|uniref:ADP-ribosylglycohydrolase family protein n=1 Tax=Magnetospira sp. (strain QH-2) TaxID=1288970 RepID=UPI0003E80DCF|nr:ADP-ribosylglycohydrolase family protein [Magnetospira sp. QH-2]CCQ74949.1 putative ADP-ribosylglycohydrolase family protein [Magnetospira sp. QH-2]
MREIRHDAFSGSFIGQCVGDALGFIVQGQLESVCRGHVDAVLGGAVGSHDPHGRIPEIHRGIYPMGQYSDDSQLARELMISYRDNQGFVPEDYAARISRIFARHEVVGGGRATREAAERLEAGIPWQEAGAPAPEAGSGSAMRAGPVGLFFHDDPETLVRAALEQGLITHADTRCQAGSVAIAGAVALAMTEDEIVPRAFLKRLTQWTDPVDADMSDALMRLADWIGLTPEKALRFIARAGRPMNHRDMWLGIPPYVVGSVLWALYSFLRSPDDFRETLRTAVIVGGDVDTTGAMAGAISGARNGLDQIPWGMADRLNDQGTWTLQELMMLAEECQEMVAAA